MKKGNTYLPGLNGIRAIACILVLIAHSNKALSGILEIEYLPLSRDSLTGVLIPKPYFYLAVCRSTITFIPNTGEY